MQISKKSAKTIAKFGVEKCKIAWEQNRVHGEGPTVCSIQSGIPVRSIDSAIEAYIEHYKCETAARKTQSVADSTIHNNNETDDIVARLRQWAWYPIICHEAAAEIERLRNLCCEHRSQALTFYAELVRLEQQQRPDGK